ncbi:hypothetical protein V1260_11760 [Brachybacterium sp. J144]|uniref:hypothetical protein n=1 Tax=Brachybacterium sp. J144 TaxID=3116487 RepID=UPI002E771062|nr:hypothetical protein [Brachybacterium sp. J144]MEE1651457.1 hypothetical protein [Brachybacterium sp. J144]
MRPLGVTMICGSLVWLVVPILAVITAVIAGITVLHGIGEVLTPTPTGVEDNRRLTNVTLLGLVLTGIAAVAGLLLDVVTTVLAVPRARELAGVIALVSVGIGGLGVVLPTAAAIGAQYAGWGEASSFLGVLAGTILFLLGPALRIVELVVGAMAVRPLP